jgi:hypothetical protein
MPGAPNRPPDQAPAPPPPAPDPPDRRVVRRLVPSQVTLLLDIWKGAPSPDLVTPFEKAEAALAASDFPGATAQLDVLSVRFAEPRWPTIPEPFRLLRVPIPPPMPPSWDPDHALPAPEKEAKRARKEADVQLTLAAGCLAWAAQHGISTTDLAPAVDAARAELANGGPERGVHERIDALWSALRPRLPRPKAAGARAPSAPAAEAEAEEA